MNDSEFDDLIKAAGEQVPVPPSFRHSVWHRIESAAVPAARGYWLSLFARPAVAGASVAAALAIGLWAGAIATPSGDDARLSYLESVSPFTHADRR